MNTEREPAAETDTDPEPDPEQVEAERAERLDPDNRPDAAEVDNTQRDFDVEAGLFTDSEDYDESEKPYAEPEDD
ncbi:hypothetical protein [Nocardioides aequoreus]|uniref:hypothetical protein n=1 Tax=Nocardioides aequoreus TaxID=397278 RepID=UPI0004C412F6|nr:hypothetical protein [Nocardioides aequoreus]